MPKEKLNIIIPLVVIFVVVIWLSLRASIPKQAEITQVTPPIKVVKEEVFQNKVIEQMKSFSQFGNLPVTLDKNLQGKDNPFAP